MAHSYNKPGLFFSEGKNTSLKSGFSVIEVIVALTILIFGASFVVVIFNARTNEGQKTVNYYVGLFIASKIIEDIDNATRENPYFIKELKTYDKTYKTVDPNSPFFINIEDFNHDGKLNEAFYSYKNDFDLRKITNYEYKITVSPVKTFENFTDKIASVKVTVMWKDGNVSKEYSLSAIFSGLPAVFELTEPDFDASITPEMNDKVRAALGSPADIKALAAALNDDYDSLYNCALLSVLVEGLKTVEHDIDVNIQSLKNSLSQDFYIKLELARLYEKKSVLLMQNFNFIKYPASRLLKIIKADKFNVDGFAHASPSLFKKIKDNIGMLRKFENNTLVANSFINRFSESVKDSFLTFLGILTDPNVSSQLGLKERRSIFLKIIDIGTAVVLNKNESIIVNLDNYQISIKQVVKNCLRNLQLYYEDRNIPKTKYISETSDRFNNPAAKNLVEAELEKKFEDVESIGRLCEFLYGNI